MNLSLDHDAMRELMLYVDTDGTLYRRMTQSIERNLFIKMRSGKYDPKKAPKAWENLLEAGAKKYAREFAGRPSEWSKMFPKAERVALSIDYARSFERGVAEGEYRHLEKMLPKKYQRRIR